MEQTKKMKLINYWGRFLIVHIVLYSLISLIFFFSKDIVFPAGGEALEFFKPFRSLSLASILIEVIRGSIIALLLYPFYDIIVKKDDGKMVLFGILWGLVLLGSVDTIPGSFEGFVYTRTTLAEHLFVIILVAIQVFLFTWIFLNWERQATIPYEDYEDEENVEKKKFFWHFILLHVITYLLMGILFMTLQDYSEAFATQERFAMMRPLDSLIVGMGPVLQIFRGALLALFVYPLFAKIMNHKNEWLLLFAVMFGFTALSSYHFIPELVHTAGEQSLADIAIGTVEVAVQMFVFSFLLYKWEKRSERAVLNSSEQ